MQREAHDGSVGQQLGGLWTAQALNLASARLLQQRQMYAALNALLQ
jgi:hypothetical protein